MNNRYLFVPEECNKNSKICIVEACSLEKAKDKFCENFYKNDELFKEDIYLKSINMSFFEKFWIGKEKKSGEYGTVEENVFEKRVRKYFKDFPSYAENLLNYWISKDFNQDNFNFPDEMLLYIYRKEFDSWINCQILNLLDIQVIG